MKTSFPVLAGHKNCTGCMTCGDACPRGCISFVLDKDGFRYPKIDNGSCVHCHLCERVCPVLNHISTHLDFPKVYAVWTSREVRMNSASGGVFFAIAEEFISKGGYVSGAVFDGYKVKHIITNSIDELKAIQGSKYFQSNASTIYKKIKQLLLDGHKVLFSGTSCQVAGLINYVGSKNENLYTVDLICYGVPSPLTIGVEERIRGKKLTRIITNRDKRHEGGWRNPYFITCEWADGSTTVSSPKDSFMLACFNSGKAMRFSCYNCQYKHIKRQADVTIGDYHNVKDFEEEKSFGISLVYSHTPKAEELFQMTNSLSIHVRDIKEALPEKRTIYYNDSMYGRHPMRVFLSFLFRNAPLWLLKISYQSIVKSRNPLVWPFSAFDLFYREINQMRANNKCKREIQRINYHENRSSNIS